MQSADIWQVSLTACTLKVTAVDPSYCAPDLGRADLHDSNRSIPHTRGMGWNDRHVSTADLHAAALTVRVGAKGDGPTPLGA
jgi:hypothetical protein